MTHDPCLFVSIRGSSMQFAPSGDAIL